MGAYMIRRLCADEKFLLRVSCLGAHVMSSRCPPVVLCSDLSEQSTRSRARGSVCSVYDKDCRCIGMCGGKAKVVVPGRNYNVLDVKFLTRKNVVEFVGFRVSVFPLILQPYVFKCASWEIQIFCLNSPPTL